MFTINIFLFFNLPFRVPNCSFPLFRLDFAFFIETGNRMGYDRNGKSEVYYFGKIHYWTRAASTVHETAAEYVLECP